MLRVSIPSRLFPGLSHDVFWPLLTRDVLKMPHHEKLESLLAYRKRVLLNLERLKDLS